MNQSVGNNFLFQQDNVSIPAVWQGTVCRLVMSYPFDWPSGSQAISVRPTWNILGRRIHDRIPSELPHFPNASWLNNGNVFHEWLGYNHRLLISMHKSPKECIHKGGGHTRYDLQYYTIIDFNEVNIRIYLPEKVIIHRGR